MPRISLPPPVIGPSTRVRHTTSSSRSLRIWLPMSWKIEKKKFSELKWASLCIVKRAVSHCRSSKITCTVLCKSNRSELREFRSLFSRTFVESSLESSSEISRRLERYFAETKGDISSQFRDLNEISRPSAKCRPPVNEISLGNEWQFITVRTKFSKW